MPTPENFKWLDPWEPVDPNHKLALQKELQLECGKHHVLWKKPALAVGRRCDCDDVAFEIEDGQVAVVHLTFASRRERSAEWPWTVIFEDYEDFRVRCMLPDHELRFPTDRL